MNEYQGTSSLSEGEETLIAVVKNIVRALDMKKNLTNDARKVLADLGSQLITIATRSENKGAESPSEIKEQVNEVQDKDMKLEVNQFMIEDYGPVNTNYGYLKAIDDTPKLTERSENLDLTQDRREDGLLQRADDILQTAMLRLEEFRNLLVWNREPLKPKDSSFPSSKDDAEDNGAISFYGSSEKYGLFQRDCDIFHTTIKTHHTTDDCSIVSFADSEEDELLQRARDILQTAVQRARNAMDDDSIVSSSEEDWHGFMQTPARVEFEQLVVQSRQPFEPEHVAICSNKDSIEASSIISSADDLVEELDEKDSISNGSKAEIFKPVNPELIPDLKSIANLMFSLNYVAECSQAYINVRSDALNNCLLILEEEKLSTDDVVKMKFKTWCSEIRRLIQSMNTFVQVYLAGEKWLCDQIFGELESVSGMCFAESSRASILRLLDFAKVVAIGPSEPQYLFKILDMYKVLSELVPDIDALYAADTASHVRMEWQETLSRLGNCAKAIYVNFEDAIAAHMPSSPSLNASVHPLTRYVMNYIILLADYDKTLDVVLEDYRKEDDLVSGSPHRSLGITNENAEHSSASPAALHFRSLLKILEGKLDDSKSKLYQNDAHRYLFLVNNIHYVIEKVKNSYLRTILGNEWICRQMQMLRQHAKSYERATWSPILSLLKYDRLQKTGKTLLRKRLQSFYTALEDVYKSQTGWWVPDIQLREELRISASINVVPAFRTFVRMHISYIGERHIKFGTDDLQNFLLDLFEGSPRSLHNSTKKRWLEIAWF